MPKLSWIIKGNKTLEEPWLAKAVIHRWTRKTVYPAIKKHKHKVFYVTLKRRGGLGKCFPCLQHTDDPISAQVKSPDLSWRMGFYDKRCSFWYIECCCCMSDIKKRLHLLLYKDIAQMGHFPTLLAVPSVCFSLLLVPLVASRWSRGVCIHRLTQHW